MTITTKIVIARGGFSEVSGLDYSFKPPEAISINYEIASAVLVSFPKS